MTSDFVLPVDKPEAHHDVVHAARQALGERRIGHTGTLDLFASGLLLLRVGRATRLAQYLTLLAKTYEAVALWHEHRHVCDREGQRSRGPKRLGRAERAPTSRGRSTLFGGEIEQVPPVYSAKKIAGVAAHRRVRRGEEGVARGGARVSIHALEITAIELPRVGFGSAARRTRMSAGSRMTSARRSAWGLIPASLRRTAMESLSVERAVSTQTNHAHAVAEAALHPLQALEHLPTSSWTRWPR